MRPPAPLHFPVEAAVPETRRHLLLRTALFFSLRHAFGERAVLSSDQFLYWDPTDPTQCLAPDVAVRLGVAPAELDVWKTWELGAPEVAVEIVSQHDRAERVFEDKLERYRRAGIGEVVRFDPEQPAKPLRLFDLHDGDLVERVLEPGGEAYRCDALGLYWVVRGDRELGPALRLARDAAGVELILTPEEAERAGKEAERVEKEAERAEKQAAQARVRELEAELARRK